MNVTVTWMDGRTESLRPDTWKVENGNLWLLPRQGSYDDTTHCIPLNNVRIWRVAS